LSDQPAGISEDDPASILIVLEKNQGGTLATTAIRRTIVEPVAITTRLVFFCSAFTCSHVSADTAPIFPVQQAALFLPLIFLGTASG